MNRSRLITGAAIVFVWAAVSWLSGGAVRTNAQSPGVSPTPAARAGAQWAPAPGPTSGSALNQIVSTPALTHSAASSRGPGDFDLPQPSAGLTTLPGYRARLDLEFKGREDGQPVERREAYTLTVSAAPAARLLESRLTSGAETTLAAMAEIGAIRYVATGGARCQVQAAGGDPGAGLLPLAASLPAVLGAEAADPAQVTLQGVAARHYRFDARSLNEPGLSSAAGEVWVADQDGFVLKYTLRVEGVDGYFGEGRSGQQTLTYTLSDFAAAPTVAAPAGCGSGELEALLPPDAIHVDRGSGHVRFDTARPLPDLAGFYARGISGWTPRGEPYVGKDRALWMFDRAGQRLTVSATAGSPTAVDAYVSAVTATPKLAPGG